MSLKLRRYPAYRESRVRWIGEVPQHWEVMPNRALFMEVNERGYPNEQMLSVTMGKGVIPQSQLLADSSKKDSSNLNKSLYKLVKPHDITYNKMRAWQGAIGVSHYRGIVSPAYVVMRPRSDQQYSGYFHYLFRTPAFAKEAERWSYGITSDQWSLRGEHFRLIYSPSPPLEEQIQIDKFLRYLNLRINHLIQGKQWLIALLEEQKMAIIHRLVTRGLDPSVRLKRSGFTWLGEVPAHWQIRRLKMLLRGIDQGISPQAEATLARDGDWGVLKSGCVNYGVFRDTQHKRLPDGFSFDPSLAVAHGDVLVSRASGSPKLVGSVAKVAQLRYQLILSDKTFRLRFKDEGLVDFAIVVMQSPVFRLQVEKAISGAEGLANNLPLSSLRDFRLPVPPTEEAQQIATYLADALKGVNLATIRAEREIALLREYRTRLVADVVTGQLDVRGVSLPPLPDPENEDQAAEFAPDLGDTDDADLLEAAAFLDPGSGD